MKRDDSLWKSILEDVFDDFLRFFVPNADDLFDLSRPFEFLDKELEQLFPVDSNDFSPKYVDKLVKVYTKEGSEKWILVHVEVQGSTDLDFSQRMFTYYYRILDKYQRPITAFAIFTDQNKRFAPSYFEQEYLGTAVRYSYNVYKVLSQKEDELLLSQNPFAVIVLVVKTALLKGKLNGDQLLALKIEIAKQLLTKKFEKSKIRALMNFLKLYVRFEDEHLFVKFDNTISELTGKRKSTMGIEQFILERAERIGEQRGIERGIERGMEKGVEMEKTAVVQNLLKVTDFDDAKIALIASTTTTFVAECRRKMNG